MQKPLISFASDNNAGVHPNILRAINSVNQGHVISYGDDIFTQSAVKKFEEHFGKDVEVYFVFNGTAANVLGLSAMVEPFNSVICSEVAHIDKDECCAPERFIGCKLVTIPTKDGKIRVEQIKGHIDSLGNQHRAQPKVISITQATELGTVYKPEEIKVIADFAHKNQLFLHMDGARLSNAAASLNVKLRQITADVGVDVLSFGGTKNGMMFGEAVIFFKRKLPENFKYIRKQGMQLASKMRFISAQFEALLSNNLWLKNAKHANGMARLLARKIEEVSDTTITQEVEANAVFAIVPPKHVSLLREKYFFYIWNREKSEVRWMASFDTTKEDVKKFVNVIEKTARSI
ncbi:MAG: aminotransferase class V-fold PLP-dependent enzyme [Clostridia bacterium]|nr:aminotransferase class V-fold PLP-dependent enzyme [Clostridia bacterium]